MILHKQIGSGGEFFLKEPNVQGSQTKRKIGSAMPAAFITFYALSKFLRTLCLLIQRLLTFVLTKLGFGA